MNCFVAVNGLANLELRTGFNKGPYGVSNGGFILGNENAFGHGSANSTCIGVKLQCSTGGAFIT